MLSVLKRLFARSEPLGGQLYDDAVAQARTPAFYTYCNVPDTLDGRFDLIVLHLCLIRFAILASVEQPTDGRLLQEMDERFVLNMDHTLREIGVGDLSVGKQVKAMLGAYNGRWAAYQNAFEATSKGDVALLTDVIARNVYRENPPVTAAKMVAYVQGQIDHLKGQGDMIRSTYRTPWAPLETLVSTLRE